MKRKRATVEQVSGGRENEEKGQNGRMKRTRKNIRKRILK